MHTLDTFLKKIGMWVTNIVATMYCAIFFTVVACLSLPAALASHSILVVVGWFAQTFLQLVLLSIILFGQTIQGESAEKLLKETHDTVMQEIALLQVEQQELKHILKKYTP